MTAKTDLDASPDREIVISRVIDAPRELVWAAWTDRQQVKHWWGPRGFTTTTHEMDVWPGGVWRYTMHGPDGTDYPNKILYREVSKPERLVYDHSGDDNPSDTTHFQSTVTFEPRGGKTLVTMRSVFPSKQERDDVVEKFGAIEGGKQHLSRLGEHLARRASDTEIVTSRMVNAPQALVFDAWTNPAWLAQWWGPKGFTNTFEQFDLRPGGDWRFVMHGPDGTDYPNHSRFVEIVPQERIVFEHLSDHAFRVTATFTPEAGRTFVTFRMSFDSKAECDRVQAFAVDKNEENLDRLEAVLNRMSGPKNPIVICVTRRYKATAEQVFDAWVDPERARRWFLRTPQGELVRAEMDARAGGRWVVIERRGGTEAYHGGVYLEIDRPRRLVFTFAVDEQLTDAGRVQVDITPLTTGCELTLRQEMHPKFAEYEERTKLGWATLLGNLERGLK